MARVLAVGGVRFVLASVLVAALAACFVGRAEAASLFSSSFTARAVFADSAAPGARVVVGDRALTLKWSAVKGASAYRVSWRGRVLKGGKPTSAWSKKWLGLKVLKASARSYKATRLVNGRQYQLRLDSKAKAKAKKSRWVARSTPVASPKAVTPAPGTYAVGDTGPGGGKVFYAPGGTFTETGAACGSSCRYLEAAPADWNSGGSPDPILVWGGNNGTPGHCSDKDIPGAAGTAIGSGFANTAAIMLACPSPSGNLSAPAAFAASTHPCIDDYSCDGEVNTGWFLPSLDELNALDISSVGGLTPGGSYWSSSQSSAGSAWLQDVGFSGGGRWQGFWDKLHTLRVRAVRAF
jgi:hypothetical protein